MAGHVHAELMMQYALDAKTNEKPWELWEFKLKDETYWSNPKSELTFISNVEYRRKPKTISINGFDVPEAVKEPLEKYAQYYAVNFGEIDHVSSYTWINDGVDNRCLKSGVIHLTKESAIQHAKALLSFTELKE